MVAELLTDDANDEDAPFLMANVYPEDTGLPLAVFIIQHGNARHDVRVKVGKPPHFIATVSVRPQVEVMAGKIAPADLDQLRRWIELNRQTIVDYWDGRIEQTKHVLAVLKPIE
jgi:hypothetical protein